MCQPCGRADRQQSNKKSFEIIPISWIFPPHHHCIDFLSKLASQKDYLDAPSMMHRPHALHLLVHNLRVAAEDVARNQALSKLASKGEGEYRLPPARVSTLSC